MFKLIAISKYNCERYYSMRVRMNSDQTNNLPLESKRITIVILIFGIFASFNWINYTYAQEAKLSGTQNTTQQQHGVRITSPTKGEQVPVGELKISGISTDDDSTDCQVSVNINDLKPLVNATATGPGGVNDYSNWTITFDKDSPQKIKPGINDLSSKLSCVNPSNVTKFYSINVTGAP
jgi:FlaG/FlaF family flagellin (archaellin)